MNSLDNKIIFYTNQEGDISLEVSLDNDTVWLTQKQMSILFDVNVPAISKHIKNILKDEELDESTISKMERVQREGRREVKREVEFYNLDMIISLGYRINSKRATSFRIWATKVLKEYIVKGYALNEKRLQENGLKELEQTLSLLKNTISGMDLELVEAQGFLDIILKYSKTWSLLQGYDENLLNSNIETKKEKFILDFVEAKRAISELKSNLIAKGEATKLFGNEKDSSFDGIIRNIYQTFGGVDLLLTTEEKSANLLYYIIKDHPFTDGNKRIGAFLFILFLAKNNILQKEDGELKINDNALVALSLLIAKSDPKQKDIVVKLIINILEE